MISIIILFYLCNIVFADCANNEIHDIIKTELGDCTNNVKSNSILHSVNVFYPNCSDVKNKVVVDTLLLEGNLPLECWLKYYLINYSAKDLTYLKDMENGDDWIIGYHFLNKNYVQYIDGRTLTILIRFDDKKYIDINRNNLFKEIYNKTSQIIQFYNMSLDDNSEIHILYKDSLRVEGYFTGTFDELSNYKKDYFWTNGRYIIFEIFKLMYPYRSFKYPGIYNEKKIINSIPKNDKKSFRRFREKGNINMRNEMFIVFPWLKDSIANYRYKIKDINGKTPSYMIKR